MHKAIEKNLFVSQTNGSEYIVLNCLYLEENVSSAVNVLTNSRKVFHLHKRDSFQLNYLHNDQ